MTEQPPMELVAMLERLGLATAAQVERMGRRVRRLARDLPQFESVWVDALLQSRILTPFQAAEINAGRGNSLRVGRYVLCERLAYPHYATCYRAQTVDSRQPTLLAVFENAVSHPDAIVRQLESLAVRCQQPIAAQPLLADVGIESGRIFAAAPWVEGRTAAQWMVHHGRFPPEVVLEIARSMLASLAELSRAGICHGDVSTASLVLTDEGTATLLLPGLRGILRPEEGYAHADLLPEAFDSLAPERVSAGTPPSVKSDMYACGCVWWHLLCGRPPLPGGDGLAKLRAAQSGEICSVRRYAPDVPMSLAAAIAACLEREPNQRPASWTDLAAMLGSPTSNGKDSLADCLARAGRPTVAWTTTVRAVRRSRRTPLWIAGAVCCLATIVALAKPAWHGLAGQNDTIAATEQGSKAKKESRLAKAAAASCVADTAGQVANQRESKNADSTSDTGNQTLDRRSQADLSQDRAVVQTAYQQQIESKPQDLVLPADQPVATGSLDIRPGQRVCGPSGRRATVLVPQAGLLVNKENVCFENINFVWRSSDADPKTASALVQLRAGRAEFCGCRFQADAKTPLPAIRWIHPSEAEPETSLPSGRVAMMDCMLQNVAAGLDCHTIGALTINMKNVLHIGGGPLVQLDHCPQADEPMAIQLAQVTLRDGGPLLECLMPRAEQQPGEITILATACAFVPASDVPLVRLSGAELPRRMAETIRWSGQGSLVAPQTPIVAWREPNGQQQTVDESSLSIAGLVRSAVGFAGKPSDDPATSQLTQWQAPLQSADPPGIDPSPLPTKPQLSNGTSQRER